MFLENLAINHQPKYPIKKTLQSLEATLCSHLAPALLWGYSGHGYPSTSPVHVHPSCRLGSDTGSTHLHAYWSPSAQAFRLGFPSLQVCPAQFGSPTLTVDCSPRLTSVSALVLVRFYLHSPPVLSFFFSQPSLIPCLLYFLSLCRFPLSTVIWAHISLQSSHFIIISCDNNVTGHYFISLILVCLLVPYSFNLWVTIWVFLLKSVHPYTNVPNTANSSPGYK